MALQDALLSLVSDALSRAKGAIYFLVGAAISTVEYLNANPKPEYYLTNSFGNIVMFVGFMTVVVRTVEGWTRSYTSSQAKSKKGQEEYIRSANAAKANFRTMPATCRSALKYQCLRGEQRFYAGVRSAVLDELLGLHVVVQPHQLGETFSSGMYMIHPALWEMRSEIIANEDIDDLYQRDPFVYSLRRI
jgi:hypothetical protein